MYKRKTPTLTGRDRIALDVDEGEKNLTLDTRRRSWRWNSAGAAKFLVARSSIIHHWNHDRVSNRGTSLIKDTGGSLLRFALSSWRMADSNTAGSCVHRHESRSNLLILRETRPQRAAVTRTNWIPRPRRTPAFRVYNEQRELFFYLCLRS